MSKKKYVNNEISKNSIKIENDQNKVKINRDISENPQYANVWTVSENRRSKKKNNHKVHKKIAILY